MLFSLKNNEVFAQLHCHCENILIYTYCIMLVSVCIKPYNHKILSLLLHFEVICPFILVQNELGEMTVCDTEKMAILLILLLVPNVRHLSSVTD